MVHGQCEMAGKGLVTQVDLYDDILVLAPVQRHAVGMLIQSQSVYPTLYGGS
jgi:hypothetical protein